MPTWPSRLLLLAVASLATPAFADTPRAPGSHSIPRHFAAGFNEAPAAG
jgi:hypothetical protein